MVDGCAFRVDSCFGGSSAEGREVAQRETFNSGRAADGSVTSTWPMASGTSEDQSRGFEGEREEVGCWSGSRGRCHDCGIDEQSPEVATLKECLSKAVEGSTGVCREKAEAFGCTRCTTQSVGERIGRGRGQSATIASTCGGTSTSSPHPQPMPKSRASNKQ